jgi:membrane associated rhomboid family serine protease
MGGGGWLPFSLASVPVVRGLLIAAAIGFLSFFFTLGQGTPLLRLLEFRTTGMDWARIWTWATYGVMVTSPIALLFQGFWLYIVGGSLERTWGARNFLALFLIFSAIGAVAFIPATLIFGVPVALHGLILPLAALTVAWAALDPDLEIRLWGVLPIRLKTIALVNVLLVYFFFGFQYGPIVALFTLAAPAAGFYYVRKMPRLNLGTGGIGEAFGRGRRQEPLLREDPPRRRREDPISRERVSRPNPLQRRKEQEELERLRKLLGEDDDGRPVRH